MNEELKQEIKTLLPWLVVAILAVGIYMWVKDNQRQAANQASAALVSSFTTDEFETAVQNYGESNAGGVLNLRLAKKYFEDGRYDEAIAIYDKLAAQTPEGFAGVPAVGRASCLEAQGKYAEALAAYTAFVTENPKSFLALSARLGAARVTALGGDQAKALAQLTEIKESVKGDAVATMRVETVEDAVKRYVAK